MRDRDFRTPAERSMDVIREVRKAWGERFAAGMVEFDAAYFTALREGKSWPDASKAGADALLDAFVETLVTRAAEIPRR